jgi:hypothetical protein
MIHPEKALYSVVRLEGYRYDRNTRKNVRLLQGTGFFYKNESENIFLITNRHIVTDKKNALSPEKLRLYIHDDWEHTSSVREIEIKLKVKGNKKNWRSSQTYSTADVVAIEIPPEEIQDCLKATFTKEDIIDGLSSPGKSINIGQHALVFGYPMDFYDEMNHFPMTRHACVATWPWFNFERKLCFLIDANLHAGMSGSPVVSYPGSIHRNPSETVSKETEREVFLLGIFSSEWVSHNEPLGLNTVWHSAVIEDICY